MLAVEDRIIRRIKDVISTLESCCQCLDSTTSPSCSNASFEEPITLSEDEVDILCVEGGKVLALYMTNICKACDSSESQRLSESVDASIQAQLLVEKDCVAIYSAAFARYLKHQDLHTPAGDPPAYDGRPCTTIPVDQLLVYVPIRTVLSVLSDFSITNGVMRIDVKNHPANFLRKIGHIACESSPFQPDAHIHYISKHLTISGAAKVIPLETFNCSQPWIIYWALHSLDLLGFDISYYRDRALHSLFECWDRVDGGFGGGKGQKAHLATTYAALCCLKILRSMDSLDTTRLYKFLCDMKQSDGTFTVHRGGEVDVRGIYCAVASASMAGILDDHLKEGVASRIAACQGYDGGIGGEPFLESHAGYVYCGTAALKLLGSLDSIDTRRLLRWCRQRQTPELGYQGRPHKLVDVCYAFWISGTLGILNTSCNWSSDLSNLLLKAYILCISQNASGGFRDKPNKPVDLYHTCYALSALEIISHPPGASKIDCALNIKY
ncbi:farnesyltransferase subunit beta [Babesia ovis]|uniref:Farnesyltransferase subunit beta n=1 Tax=Babesia ovis TaxID=5869 RepID=A0A9W5T989_BABOV|nr:farnesyltransferase subunit beta [Babesia ovis]